MRMSNKTFQLGFNAGDARRIIWSAIFAFGSVYLPFVTGLGAFPNWSEAKAAAAALLPAALAAAYSAIKNGVLADGSRLK